MSRWDEFVYSQNSSTAWGHKIKKKKKTEEMAEWTGVKQPDIKQKSNEIKFWKKQRMQIPSEGTNCDLTPAPI